MEGNHREQYHNRHLFQAGLLMDPTPKIKHIVSISPGFKNVLVIKEMRELGLATYYRTYFGIFARPQESLPFKTSGKFKVKWLEKDICCSYIPYTRRDNSPIYRDVR